MSNEFIGRQIDFALAVESTRGTAESVADRNVRKVTCNLIPRAERVEDDTTFGKLEDVTNIRTTRKWNEGDVAGIAHVDVLGYYFYNIYGDVTSALVGGTTYSHEFLLDQTILHPSLTFFVKDGDVRQEKLAGGMITTLELTANTDNYVRYTANFLAMEGETDTSTIPALETEYDFIGRDVTVKIADTSGGLAGATALKLKDLNITFNTNTEANFVFGDYSPDAIYNKQFTIEGSFTKDFVDETFKDMYEDNTNKYMEIKIEGEANISGTNKPTVIITLNKVAVTDWNRTSEGDALVTEDVSFKALYNETDGRASKVNLINATVSYATES